MNEKYRPGRGRPTGPKFTPSEREAVLELVAHLDRHGYNQYDIARRVGKEFGEEKELNQATISDMLKLIRERYMILQNANRDEDIAITRMRIRDVYRQAYEAWERSCTGVERVVEEHMLRPIPSPGRKKGNKIDQSVELERKLELIKRTIMREGRAGASQFLNVMADCIKQERELRGLDEPKRTINDVNASVVQVNWNDVLGMSDEVEKRLEGEESKVSESARKLGPQLRGGLNGDSSKHD